MTKHYSPKDARFAFFGTPELATIVLDSLEEAGFVPTLVVSAPDRPVGRKQVVESTPVKAWAESRGIDVLQPESLKDRTELDVLYNSEWDFFVVAAYGLLLPEDLLDIPQHGALNMHPSLLPRWRGPSPVRAAILADEKQTGVSIMLLDAAMDHGPVLAQASVEPDPWPPKGSLLETLLFQEGGSLLTETLPLYIAGEVTPEPQDDSKATFSKILSKADGEIDLSADPYQNYLKIQAFDGWPGTFFFKDTVRMKITEAMYVDGELKILRVIPEGKKEQEYKE